MRALARRCLTACAILVAVPRAAAAQTTVPPPLAIVHVTVIPMDRPGVLRDRTVVVRGSRIVAVTPARVARVPAGARVVDGRGRFLIPGLWDMHVHAVANADSALGLEREARGWTLPLLVANGVTGARDMGAVLDTMMALRRSLASDTAAVPRLVVAGALLDGPTPWGGAARHAWTVRTPDEARFAVDSLRRAGVDFIKVHDFLASPVFFAAAAEARRVGLPLAGHLRPEVSPAAAADSGQASFEHLAPELGAYCAPGGRERATGFYRAWIAGGMAAFYRGMTRLWETRDAGTCAALLAHLRAAGTWIDPTLVLRMPDRAAGSDTALLTPGGRAQCRAALEELRQVGAGARDSSYRAMEQEVGALRRAGLRLVAGTDAPGGCRVPGASLHAELRELVRAGLTPWQALAAATTAPARLLGAEDSRGSVTPGKEADLVLLDADPLRDIGNARRIAGVVLRGRWLSRADLDALVDRARRTATGR